jgi:hypothetical protein
MQWLAGLQFPALGELVGGNQPHVDAGQIRKLLQPGLISSLLAKAGIALEAMSWVCRF